MTEICGPIVQERHPSNCRQDHHLQDAESIFLVKNFTRPSPEDRRHNRTFPHGNHLSCLQGSNLCSHREKRHEGVPGTRKSGSATLPLITQGSSPGKKSSTRSLSDFDAWNRTSGSSTRRGTEGNLRARFRYRRGGSTSGTSEWNIYEGAGHRGA